MFSDSSAISSSSSSTSSGSVPKEQQKKKRRALPFNGIFGMWPEEKAVTLVHPQPQSIEEAAKERENDDNVFLSVVTFYDNGDDLSDDFIDRRRRKEEDEEEAEEELDDDDIKIRYLLDQDEGYIKKYEDKFWYNTTDNGEDEDNAAARYFYCKSIMLLACSKIRDILMQFIRKTKVFKDEYASICSRIEKRAYKFAHDHTAKTFNYKKDANVISRLKPEHYYACAIAYMFKAIRELTKSDEEKKEEEAANALLDFAESILFKELTSKPPPPSIAPPPLPLPKQQQQQQQQAIPPIVLASTKRALLPTRQIFVLPTKKQQQQQIGAAKVPELHLRPVPSSSVSSESPSSRRKPRQVLQFPITMTAALAEQQCMHKLKTLFARANCSLLDQTKIWQYITQLLPDQKKRIDFLTGYFDSISKSLGIAISNRLDDSTARLIIVGLNKALSSLAKKQLSSMAPVPSSAQPKPPGPPPPPPPPPGPSGLVLPAPILPIPITFGKGLEMLSNL